MENSITGTFSQTSDSASTKSSSVGERGRVNVCRYSETVHERQAGIFNVAKAFLAIAPMTHKKLQKLCYYAKAWYLALYDHNLIEEQFEAWVHGAVQPDLYQYYRRYGYNDIPKNDDISNIPEEVISFTKEVYASYGHLTGDELERLNHQERPWREARGNCKPWESCSNVISEDAMRNYYRELLK